ncbi:hypothetical protein QQF64_018811 [Cirrhinus molitorella]|uniref:Uncharacterized protein n=1 Tax=Cirrhinus molitorella TaxID=172907 RepID=A0ABR3LDR8_9TELE
MRNAPKAAREGGVMLCGRMHARLYPRTRQNDSYDDRAATVPAPPSLPAHKWLLCASVNLGAEPAGHDERGPFSERCPLSLDLTSLRPVRRRRRSEERKQ